MSRLLITAWMITALALCVWLAARSFDLPLPGEGGEIVEVIE